MGDKPIVKTVEEGLEGAPPWVATFVDMCSLLVTFFILLFSFSSTREFETFASPKNIFGSRGVAKSKGNTMSAPENDLMLGMDLARGSQVRHTRPVDQLSENLEEMGQKLTEAHQEIDLGAVSDGLRIEFDVDAGFGSGSTVVAPALEVALRELANTVKHYPLVVLVEGHTDDAFKPTGRHPDELALSIARARAAATVLTARDGLAPALVQVVGLGSRAPRATGPSTAITRKENRRVSVRLVAMSKDRFGHTEGGR